MVRGSGSRRVKAVVPRGRGYKRIDNQVELRVEALLVRLYIHVGDRYLGSESESRIARARRG